MLESSSDRTELAENGRVEPAKKHARSEKWDKSAALEFESMDGYKE